MKRKRYTEEKIISMLKQHEGGRTMVELAREHGIAENTLYRWKSKYGGMEVSEITPKDRGILLKRAVILASHDPCFMFGEMPVANTVMKDSNARSLSPGHTPIKQRMRLLKRSYI